MSILHVIAWDVLPKEVVLRVLDVIPKPMRITFGKSGAERTFTEEKLPPELATEIRRLLDEKGLLVRRTLYFRRKPRTLDGIRPTAEEAHALANAGFPLSVVADALGVSSQTIFRWGVRVSQTPFDIRKLVGERRAKCAAFGKEWLALLTEIGVPTHATTRYSTHPVLVGAARVLLLRARKAAGVKPEDPEVLRQERLKHEVTWYSPRKRGKTKA